MNRALALVVAMLGCGGMIEPCPADAAAADAAVAVDAPIDVAADVTLDDAGDCLPAMMACPDE